MHATLGEGEKCEGKWKNVRGAGGRGRGLREGVTVRARIRARVQAIVRGREDGRWGWGVRSE
jgi:hypothetical protein